MGSLTKGRISLVKNNFLEIEVTRENKSIPVASVISTYSQVEEQAGWHPFPWLSDSERLVYEGYTAHKRKRDYLLGRYAAKKAASVLLGESDYKKISILSGVFNQPVLYHHNNKHNIQVSITHAASKGAAIAFPETHPMGIDIEKVEGKLEGSLKSVMTNADLTQLYDHLLLNVTGLTLAWSAKEALSKVLRTGFTVSPNLYAIKSMQQMENVYLFEFKEFHQYKVVSWFFADYVGSICLPKRSHLKLHRML